MFEELTSEGTDSKVDKQFVLDSDQLDSILLESQAISPAEKAKLEGLILEANAKISVEFSDIITPIPDSEMSKKFVFVNRDTMNELEDVWDPDTATNRSYATKDETGGRAFLKEGQFVIELPIGAEYWDGLTKSNKETLIEDNGTEEDAKNMVQRALNLNIILHEGTHLYQQPIDTTAEIYLLRETQANWSERQFTTEGERVYWSDHDKKADFYQTLIDKYGKRAVHEYAITGNIQEDPWITFDIDAEFSDEVKKDLFPNLKNG